MITIAIKIIKVTTRLVAKYFLENPEMLKLMSDEKHLTVFTDTFAHEITRQLQNEIIKKID